MKTIVETTNDGIESLLGKTIQVWCCNYIYQGHLSGVSDTTLKLENASVVYETGPLKGPNKTSEELPAVWFVQLTAVESFGEVQHDEK